MEKLSVYFDLYTTIYLGDNSRLLSGSGYNLQKVCLMLRYCLIWNQKDGSMIQDLEVSEVN